MKVVFEAARWEGSAWVPAEMEFDDGGREAEIEVRIDGVLFRHFAEEMADALALMLVRKDRK